MKTEAQLIQDLKALIGFKLEEIDFPEHLANGIYLYFRKKGETAVVAFPKLSDVELDWNP